MLDRYEPKEFEAKWRQRWLEADLFATREEEGREKFYGLDFFPYPSGAGLSVGHCRNYVPTDVLCRMKYMQGYNVLHPMGFDAFGLPAENEAIKTKTHPAPMIDKYAATYKRQMDLVGISYDWSRSFKSCEPSYYKWTQWIFELLYKKGLAYRRDAEVNWCPKDKTALANEEVVAGHCERCGTAVEKRNIPQWFFKITDYAQRLIDDLDDVDWPEGIKNQQRNWIGRSEGVQFRMRVVFDAPADTSGKSGLSYNSEPTDELAAFKAEVAAEGAAENPGAMAKIDEIKSKLDRHAGDIENPLGLERASATFDAMREKVTSKIGEDFEVKNLGSELSFDVFTTRVDTVFGVTFCVLAPEHPLVERILVAQSEIGTAKAVTDSVRGYVAQAKTMGDLARLAEGRDKTGVFIGAYAVNPANGKRVPIYVADYVMMGYGTGAIMAVPGHDQRDFEFAKKFELDIVPVIAPSQTTANQPEQELPFDSKDGVLVNSGEYSGQAVKEAQKNLAEWMEACGIGVRKVNYRLRDWLISRQRYWGCPIPVCYDKEGHADLIPGNQLPVELPDVESYEPSDDGSSPLSRIPEFVNCTTPDGTLGRRETDTMGGFACSSWYFLRFCDPHNDEAAWNPDRVAYWMPVDTYVGGAEHAVMHLLYARFWTKVLYDEGLVPVKEPFQRLKNQGQVLGHTPYRKPREGEELDIGEDGVLLSYDEARTLPEADVTWKWVRMSKSKGNVVTPDEAVESYGADALRVFELFVAPFDSDVEWNNDGMTGTARFLGRVFRLVSELANFYDPTWRNSITAEEGTTKEIRRATHKAIKKSTEDIDRFAFNTYVSGLMEYLNTLNDLKKSGVRNQDFAAWSEAVETVVLLLAPGAPHTSDELWESLGKTGFTYHANWPKFDPDLAKDDLVTVAVQVNGKLRDTVEMSADATNPDLEAAAMASEKVQHHLAGLTVRKVIVIPGKLVNVVAN